MSVKTVGLTGGIGSGKTFVARIFKIMNIPVYNSDLHAKRLMTEDSDVIRSLKDLLGVQAYDSEGGLDRTYIANVVFKDPVKLGKLNEIVHPAVRRDFKNYVETLSDSLVPYIINEAALFVENGTYKDFDVLASVVAPEALRIKRILSRDDTDITSIQERMQAQSSDQSKIEVSDFVIYNDACDNLFTQITKIHAELLTFVEK